MLKTQLLNGQSGVLISMQGHITGNEVLPMHKQAADLHEAVFFIWDLTQVESVSLSHDDLHTMALVEAKVPLFDPPSKIALVGSSANVSNLSKRFLAFRAWTGSPARYVIEHFSHLELAQEWIRGD